MSTKLSLSHRTASHILVGAFVLVPLVASAQGAKEGAKSAPTTRGTTATSSAGAPATSSAPAAAADATAAAPGSASPESAGSAGMATGTSGTMDGPTYAVRLRDLEVRINELKEQIRRSH